MMHYLQALRDRRRALMACSHADLELGRSLDGIVDGYVANPAPILAGCAILGFAMARWRIGDRLMKTSMRIATGPAWSLVRQFMQHLG